MEAYKPRHFVTPTDVFTIDEITEMVTDEKYRNDILATVSITDIIITKMMAKSPS